MRILGLDPSLTHSAMSWMAPDGSHRRSSIISKPSEHKLERLIGIRSRFTEVAMNLYTGEERYVFIEGFSFGSKGTADREIGWLGFQMRITFHECGWNIVEVPPTTLKAYTCGTGTAKKELMLQQVYKRWSYETSDNNEADAFALMKLGESYLPWAKALDFLPPSQKDAKLFAKLHIIPPAR